MLALLLQAAPAAPVADPCPNPDALPARAAAKRCEGMALASGAHWRDAATAFEAAAALTDPAQAAALWTQAGNAWLAAGDPARAGTALDTALVRSDGRPGFDRGELLLDRARVAVAGGDLDGARRVMNQALTAVPTDPLAWLLSATLARRMGQPPRAATDIAEALRLAPDDAAVQLEAGNIAALAGDEPRARERWGEAARLQPAGPSGRAAAQALTQFGPAPSAPIPATAAASAPAPATGAGTPRR
ncbi:tetratricopeptide repeat protein [Sphingomonas sp.]|uniref:tetratricopeptide repeat protein n=1 Tax=Sphingomonas sp. TaxID=28214 RepID=UPI003CC5B92A